MLAVAEKYMALSSSKEITLIVIDQLTERKPYGNIYYYNSKDYIDTWDSQYELLTAPFLVEKATGRVVNFGTARSLEFYLEQYENGTLEPSLDRYWYLNTKKYDYR